MISAWMLYAAAIGGLITLAAMAIERVAVARARPVRFIWLVAIVLSIVWPVANAIQRAVPAADESATVLPFAITLPSTAISADGPTDRGLLVDRLLISLWAGLSILLVARIGHAVLSLRRNRNAWRLSTVDGTSVRLSDNVGPAVIGLRSMDVVLPQWIMTLEPSLRAIVLCHEEEHRLARDPYLLFAAGVAVALMPWNVALWMQARRLRLAIEMDCDGRVLRAHPSPERYGMLMLTIVQRRSTAPAMFAPMLSEPTTQLERRILAMRTTRRRFMRLTVYGGSALAAGALLLACALKTDGPTSPSPLSSRAPSTASEPYFEFQVEKQVAPKPGNTGPKYPATLRAANVEGVVLAQFVVDTFGRADMRSFKVLKSDHDLFTATVESSLPGMEFTPAEVGNRKVKQLVQMPFQFSLSHDDSNAAHAPVARHTAIPRKPGAPEVLKLAPVAVTDVGTPAAAGPTRVSDSTTFKEFQIEKSAAEVRDGVAPRYPDVLRDAKVEGEVTAQFVVGVDGHPIPSTLKILASSHELFTASVRNALPMLKYSPAEVGGHPVKQLVKKTFSFSLQK
jgi:beta-lactamase regulating signal transducer with metallopeptidase domain/outer membrane biosynthesis protein TonB